MSPPAPLRLPVRAAAQTAAAQQLATEVESVRVIGIRLILVDVRHRPVVVGQPEFSVDCVCVKREFTEI